MGSEEGVKEWLSRHFPRNRRYKPTLDQLPMTRMLNFDRLRRAEVPCFGTLERAVTFLDRAGVARGQVAEQTAVVGHGAS